MRKINESLVRRGPRVYGKIIEYENGRSKYVTKRDQDGYVLKYAGYGISEDVLNWLVSKNVDKIVLRYKWNETRTSVYKISPKSWSIMGVTDSLGGFESQVFLSEDVLIEVGHLYGDRVTPILRPYYQPYYDTDLPQSDVNSFLK